MNAVVAQFGDRARQVIDMVEKNVIKISSVGCDISDENLEILLSSIRKFLESGAAFYWIVVAFESNSVGIIIDRLNKNVIMCSTDGTFKSCKSVKAILDNCAAWNLVMIETPAHSMEIACELIKGKKINEIARVEEIGATAINTFEGIKKKVASLVPI